MARLFLFSNIRTRVINGLLGKEVQEEKVQARYIKALWQPVHEIVYIKAESKQITR
jgi:hypothetical protein